MPVKTVRKDHTQQVWDKALSSKKRILKDEVEEQRTEIVPLMRVDTGAQKKGVYIKGPGFNDYWEQLLEAAKLYEGKVEDPGREMKQSEEQDLPDDEDSALVGASAGHSVEIEFGLGIPAEPIFLPVASGAAPRYFKRVERDYLK